MKKNNTTIAAFLVLNMLLMPQPIFAQQLTSNAQSQVTITKGATPASLRRKLKEDLQVRVVRNLMETSFSIKITPQVEAKIPEIIEVLGESIEVAMDPSDGEVLSGRARITVPTAKLKEILIAKGIGAGDIAAQSARILISIDEYIGVATTNNAKTATEVEVNYSHDKSAFSDTSAKASGSQTESASSASSSKKDVNYANREAVAVSGSRSSAVAARQDTAVAARRDTAASYQGADGRAAGATSAQYAGAQSSQYAAAQKSQYAGAASSSTNYSDKGQTSNANSSASASSFSGEQKNIQQQNDKVSYSVKTKMPEFGNAKPLSGSERLIASKLGSVFSDNGLVLVSESDLRAEGGRLLSVSEIINNGREDQFVERIRQKKLEADAWATGAANYNIVGTTASGTQCNGTMEVQIRMLETNQMFPEPIRADAIGNGDQDCRARLGLAMANALAKKLSERVLKELNARASRGTVYTLYLYSATTLGRGDRNKFQTTLKAADGLQASEPRVGDNYMAVSVQMASSLDATINKVLDSLNWEKADYVSRPGNRICIGLEGKQVCPADLR